MRSTHKALLLHTKVWLYQGKSIGGLFELATKLAAFIMEHHFYLKNNRQAMVIQPRVFGRYFLENKHCETLCSRRTANSVYCWWSNLSFQAKIRILKNLYPLLWASPKLKTFLMRSVTVLTIVGFFFFYWYNEKYQHLEDLRNSVKYLPKDPMQNILKSYMGKSSIQSQDNQMGFNVTVWKVYWYGFVFHVATWETILSHCGTVWKNIYNYLKMLL